MRAATLLTSLLVLTASAAWAAYASFPVNDLIRPVPGSADEIVITVAPEDLSRCIVTLLQVMQMPVDPAFVTDISVDMPDAPTVRCQAE